MEKVIQWKVYKSTFWIAITLQLEARYLKFKKSLKFWEKAPNFEVWKLNNTHLIKEFLK